MQVGRGEEGGVNFANCWLTGSDIDPGVDCRRRRRRLQEPRRPRGGFSDAASKRILFDIFWSYILSRIWDFSSRRRDHICLSHEEDIVKGNDKYIGE